MTPDEYFDAAKSKMGIESDYELAKRFEMPRAQICDIRKGKRPVDNATAFRIAVTLEADPAEVIADLESQREKTPEKAAFWRGFISRAKGVAAILLCTLVWSFSGFVGNGQNTHGGFNLRRRFA